MASVVGMGGQPRCTSRGTSRADIPTEAGGIRHVEENTVLILDSDVPLGFYVQGGWTNPFTDVPESAWYYDAIRFVNENGLMNGIDAGTFSPDANLTRAMLTQILYNKEGRPAVDSGSAFTDVAAGAWYCDAVAWASANGVVNGYGNGCFGPGDSITREQLIVMLWRYSGSPAASVQTLSFSDSDQISSYALDALRWAAESGIINGDNNGALQPKGLSTRAQVAQVLYNLFG